ncbi:ribonuclease H-like protein [Massarina eburnea CBS 473.64]|uniref:Ribonuclease H-like protein n=1 Tax=Massarina eburnea CBS 473.64 TaxID=1395130 RepID=A0A6A6RKY3_9PLEO|nr:ribonuclease H-like protein [Massarina eburnea CBS 473.64]
MAQKQNIISLLHKSTGTTVKTLHHVLRNIGCATSGRKDVLQRRILDAAAPRRTATIIMPKILSIDMGIKNLAFCVASVKQPSPGTGAAMMDIEAWGKLDLTKGALQMNRSTDSTESALGNISLMPIPEEINGEDKERDPFELKYFSTTACSIANVLLSYEPDIILIERQRWRSSSSVAIQQWTVRVNSLEAMFWALFTSFKGQTLPNTPKYYLKEIESMEPKRVKAYWLDDLEIEDPPKPTRRRTKKPAADAADAEEGTDISSPSKKVSRGQAEKKAKIQLLRTWLESQTPSTTISAYSSDNEDAILRRPSISFNFIPSIPGVFGDPLATRDTFLSTTEPTVKRRKREDGLKTDTKVDDITDCFLQAVAYVAWEDGLAELMRQREEHSLINTEVEETRAEITEDSEEALEKESDEHEAEPEDVKPETKKKKTKVAKAGTRTRKKKE